MSRKLMNRKFVGAMVGVGTMVSALVTMAPAAHATGTQWHACAYATDAVSGTCTDLADMDPLAGYGVLDFSVKLDNIPIDIECQVPKTNEIFTAEIDTSNGDVLSAAPGDDLVFHVTPDAVISSTLDDQDPTYGICRDVTGISTTFPLTPMQFAGGWPLDVTSAQLPATLTVEAPDAPNPDVPTTYTGVVGGTLSLPNIYGPGSSYGQAEVNFEDSLVGCGGYGPITNSGSPGSPSPATTDVTGSYDTGTNILTPDPRSFDALPDPPGSCTIAEAQLTGGEIHLDPAVSLNWE